MSKTIGVFQEFVAPQSDQRGFKYSYRRVRFNKANPRSREYMESLFKERFPEGEFLTANENEAWQEKASSAEKVVLLYPDSTGLEFSNIEKWATDSGKRVLALNGRRRLFPWNGQVKVKLQIRRFMENFMVGEIIFAGVFIILTPVFLFIDWARGRI